MKKILLLLLIALLSIEMSAQAKKAGTRTSRQNTTAKKTVVTKKLTGFDLEYKGEVGDYLPFIVKFQPESSTLDTEAIKAIKDVAHYLKNHPNANIVAVAYTQSGPDALHCKELSNLRAREVKSALVFNHNIDQIRIIGNGKGMDHGLASCFCNTSDVVLFYERGFIAYMDLEKSLSERFSGVEAAVLGAMINVASSDFGEGRCSYCNGTGSSNGNLCPKCKGKGTYYDEAKAMSGGAKAGKNIASAAKKTQKKVTANNYSNGYQIRKYANGTYEGYMTNGKRNGRGLFLFDNGSCYSGEWKNDEITGWGMVRSVPALDFDEHWNKKILCQRHVGRYEGGQLVSENRTLFYPNGEIFIGTMASNGKLKAYGKKIMPDGKCYVGNWVNGKCNGKGMLYFSNCVTTVQGTFKDGEFVGNVIYNSPGWGKYTGEYQNGTVTGRGIKTWPDGAMSEGRFREGEMVYGATVWPDGRKYIGGFFQNQFAGESKLTYGNGDIYEGAFYKGKRNGKGFYQWADGDVFYGNYVDDMRNGQGTFYEKSTRKYTKATWNSDKVEQIESQGTFTDDDIISGDNLTKHYENGDNYEGSLKWGMPHGKGIYTWRNGERYDGEFFYGEKRGEGVMYYSDKRYVYGVWTRSGLSVTYKKGKWKGNYRQD